MKKVLLSLRALLLILMLGWAGSALAHDFIIDGVYYTVDNTTLEATVSGCEAQQINPRLEIPETVTWEGVTYTVTAIKDHCLYNKDTLTDLIIPNTVTSIGTYAFWECDNLRSIYIGSGVQSIGRSLIYECYNLESLAVHPDNPYFDSRGDCNAIIETATGALIYGCKNTVFPDDITEIGETAFYGTSAPENVVLPNSVTKIGSNAFFYTRGVKSITLGSGVADMEQNPFSHIPDLEALSVHPDNPKYDSRGDCKAVNLTATNMLFAACRNTVIPDDITSIGSYAYGGCRGLDRIIIPPSVTLIKRYAFCECDVRHMTIPGTVKVVEMGAFDFCGWVQDVYIEDGVEQLGRETFRLCVAMKHLRLPNTITEIPYGMLWQCDSLTELIIPNSVTKVNSYAAYSCPLIKRLVIGSGVTQIGGYALSSAHDATTVTCLAPVPPSTSIMSLSPVWPEHTILRVPYSSLELYKSDYDWKDGFLEIVGCNDDGSAGPGDSDGDGIIGVNDATMIIDAILSGDTSSLIVENADLNGNGRLDIGDVATLIDMILHP